MDDILDLYVIEDIEQMRAISDTLRMRIAQLLSKEPMTVTQLGEKLGQSPAKVHYHVRELERVGLVRLVETREKGGILEKYYRTIARNVSVSPSLLRSVAPDESVAAIQEMLDLMTREATQALIAEIREKEHGVGRISIQSLWMTIDEFRALDKQISDLLEPYDHPRVVDGEREVMLNIVAYEQRHNPDEVEEIPAMPYVPPVPPLPPLPAPPEPPKRETSFVAGVLIYSRIELEEIVARGAKIDINILGHISFANDISADLADRAIGRFRHRGSLSASPEVRAVLKRKEEEQS